MSNYQEGKIYQISCDTTKQIYYGSTTTSLEKCLKKLVTYYNAYKKGKGSYSPLYKILENNDYKIELIENYSCDSKEELFIKKSYWRMYYITNYTCVNKDTSLQRTKKKYPKLYKEIFGKDTDDEEL